MIASARSPPRRERPVGRALRTASFANGEYGAGWNGVVRDEFVKQYGADGVRGILYGDASQLWMQVIDCVAVSVFGFVMALRLVQGQ